MESDFTDKDGNIREKTIGYKPDNPEKITLVVTDHRLMWL